MKTIVAPRMMVATLEDIQREFPVFDWQVAGVHVWPLARLRWIVGVWSQAFSTEVAGPPSVSAKRLSTVLRGAQACASARRRDTRAEDRIGAQRDLVFLSDGVSFATLSERRFERFCDPLIEHAHRQGLSTQMWTPMHLYLVPRATPSRFVQPALDRANAMATIEARLRSPAVHLPGWDALKQWLAARALDTPALDRARLTRDAIRIRHVTRLYSSWLRKVEPRAAFVVCYYSLEAMAFVRACRHLGIPVTDLQHGVQGEGHGAYAGWGQVPAQADELLPDYFWVWSQWEADAITAGLDTARVCRPVVGGNPWMDFWTLDGHPDTTAASASARSLLDLAGERPVVLVTLQFGLSDGLQLDPLRHLISLCGDQFAWWVRLHPAMGERRDEVRTKIGGMEGAPVWLDQPSDLPLPALLRHARVHLTHSSSTVIEAACLGVPSIVTSESGRDLFGPYIEQGMARVEVGGLEELRAALQDCVTKSLPRAEHPKVSARHGSLDRAFAKVTGFGPASLALSSARQG
ncbi:MAG: hypothetical protein ABI702_00280 [Burkholderiales bacterium]